MTTPPISIVPSADLPPAEVYTAVQEELGVWPMLSAVPRGVDPDLVVYVSTALGAFGGAVLDQLASRSVDGLVGLFRRLTQRAQPGPERVLRVTDELTGVVFVVDTPQARTDEALHAMVRPDGWAFAAGTELRWDPDARTWHPAATGPAPA